MAEDSLQPIESISTIERAVWNQLTTERFYLSLAGTFAIAALVLAALGIYGVVAYTVAQRTREIGIRVALGAQRADVRRIMLRLGGGLAATGVAVGLLVSLWVSGMLESYLYEVRPTEPGAFVLVAASMLVVAMAAVWLPTRRALRVDPMEALRAD
jgi:putative ABC transport system permease protein